MKVSHIHIGVQDLGSTVDWMRKILLIDPSYQNDGMAVISLSGLTFVFDRSDENTSAVIAFDSVNCDQDFDQLIKRGAIATEMPKDQPWGVRTAYFQGPGKITFELEQTLR